MMFVLASSLTARLFLQRSKRKLEGGAGGSSEFGIGRLIEPMRQAPAVAGSPGDRTSGGGGSP